MIAKPGLYPIISGDFNNHKECINCRHNLFNSPINLFEIK